MEIPRLIDVSYKRTYYVHPFRFWILSLTSSLPSYYTITEKS